MPERVTVAVVGGGIAGLAAARALARTEPAPHVILFEAADRVGGKIDGGELEGAGIELGADQFLRRDPSAEQLCRELGLGDDLMAPAAGTAAVWARDRLRQLPRGLVLGVPTDPEAVAVSGIVSPLGVERLRADSSLDGPLVTEAEVGLDPDGDPALERSAGVILRGRLGDEVVDRLVDPLLGGINSGGVDSMSLGVAAPQIARALVGHRDVIGPLAATIPTGGAQLAAGGAQPAVAAGSVFLGLRGGLRRMVDACAEELRRLGVEVRTGAAVRAIEGGAGWAAASPVPDPVPTSAWRIVTDAGTVAVDGIVLATPAGPASVALRALAPRAAALLSDIAYASVAVTTFAFHADELTLPGDGAWTGWLVPRIDGMVMTAATHLGQKWPWMVAEGLSFVRVSAGRYQDRRIGELDDDEMATHLLGELRHAAGLSESVQPVARRVTRWENSFPQYRPGHRARIEQTRTELAVAAPGIALAGAMLGGIGIPACITSGTAAAERLVAHLSALPGAVRERGAG